MAGFAGLLRRLSAWMNSIGGVVLFLMMMLTVIDVIVRVFGKPLTGTYELVSVAGAIVVGFAIPQTTQENAHIYVDFLLENRGQGVKRAFQAGTKLLGVALFALLGWNLFLKANHLYRSGDVSLTLQIPYYPAAYALALCALIEMLVLLCAAITTFIPGENNG